jgi:branched-chain amino acid transport system permease protein
MSSGYSLVYGIGKVANLAYGHMVIAAIFMSYLTLVFWDLNFWIGAPLAVFVAVLISVGTMVLLERVTDDDHRVIFLSLGLAIILENVLLAIFGGTYRFAPTLITGLFEFGGVRIQNYRIVVFAITITIFFVLSAIIAKTRLGRSMRAVSQSEDASWLMGIDVKRVKFATSAIAGILAGLSALLLLPIYSIYPSMGWEYLLIGFAIVILGGLGSLNGTLIGGIILGVTESLFGFYFIPGLRGAVYFVVIIIMLLIRPHGILGKKEASH